MFIHTQMMLRNINIFIWESMNPVMIFESLSSRMVQGVVTPSRAQARALCFLLLFGVLGARPTHPVRLQAYMAKQAERWRGRPFPWSPSSRHGNKLYKHGGGVENGPVYTCIYTGGKMGRLARMTCMQYVSPQTQFFIAFPSVSHHFNHFSHFFSLRPPLECHICDICHPEPHVTPASDICYICGDIYG